MRAAGLGAGGGEVDEAKLEKLTKEYGAPRTHTRARTRTHTHARTHARTHIHACAHTRTRTQAH